MNSNQPNGTNFISESTLVDASASKPNHVSSARPDSLELTVYQAGDAVIHETRTVHLAAGKNSILIEGLPAQFVEDSFETIEVGGPAGFKLGADCFSQADLSTAAVLQKAVGSKVTFIEQTQQGVLRHTGKLLFILGNQVVLQGSEGVQVLPLTPKFELPELPSGLSATPSLTLEPTTKVAGAYVLNSLYETGGLSWSARYSAHYDEKAGKLVGLRCRVKLSNETGADFDNAVFKLLAAANTSRSRGGNRGMKGGMARAASLESVPMAAMAMSAPEADSASVESIGEQKIYVLPEGLSIRTGQTKRPYLFVKGDVPVKAEYYLPQGYNYLPALAAKEDSSKLPVFVRLRLRNDVASNLGTALPAGELAVYQPDSAGKFQKTDPSLYLGAVAAGEAFKVELRTPSSDLKATRVLRDFHEDPVEEVEEVEVTPEGGLPITTQGGPDVGTPEAHARLTAEVLETADTAGEGKKKASKPKPRFRTEQREVTVYNFKDRAVTVHVHEQLPGNKTQVLQQSHAFSEQSDSQGTFALEVPAGGKVTVSYGIKWQVN
jgi:hypothetical protein